MTFEIMAYVMAVGATILGLRFMVAGGSVLREWGLEVTDTPLIMCRRLGALYLALAVVFFLGRDTPASDLRSALCVGIGGGSALLAALGLVDLQAGRVTTGIVVPVIVEVVLAAGFGWAWWAGRQ